MPSHHDTQISPYTPEQLFALVADVARYPEFLPWCRAARVRERTEAGFLGELVIHFKGLTERYTSRVSLHPPQRIEVEMVEGPFQYLTNRWKFTENRDGTTTIDFTLDFAFRSKMLEKMIGPLFAKATGKMAAAFRERAEELYGLKVER